MLSNYNMQYLYELLHSSSDHLLWYILFKAANVVRCILLVYNAYIILCESGCPFYLVLACSLVTLLPGKCTIVYTSQGTQMELPEFHTFFMAVCVRTPPYSCSYTLISYPDVVLLMVNWRHRLARIQAMKFL
jgi:hypothetical protein